MLLRDVLGTAGVPRIVCVDPITGHGRETHRTRCASSAPKASSQNARQPLPRRRVPRLAQDQGQRNRRVIVITGSLEPEAVAVAELQDGALVPAEFVKVGLAGKELLQRLDRLGAGPSTRSGLVPVCPGLVAAIRYFGRYRTGWIHDGVLLKVD